MDDKTNTDCIDDEKLMNHQEIEEGHSEIVKVMLQLRRNGVQPQAPCPDLDVVVSEFLNVPLIDNEFLAELDMQHQV